MKKVLYRTFILSLYGTGIVFALAVARFGWHYYSLPTVERPHDTLHQILKPGGLWGHGLGIIGSCMILLLFLYSARKRELLCLRFGRMRRWLDVHIFFGIMGPILITLHTAMKFNGIVAISYFSMLAVMFSGIFGRYIYKQIPRDKSGMELTLEQIKSQDRSMTQMLFEKFHVSDAIQSQIHQISGAHLADSSRGLSAFFLVILNDMKRPFLFRKFRRALSAQNTHIPAAEIAHILHIAKQKSLLLRKRAFLNIAHEIFHYWHVIHKPFAYVMIIIMFVHISVAVLFGYRWVF